MLCISPTEKYVATLVECKRRADGCYMVFELREFIPTTKITTLVLHDSAHAKALFKYFKVPKYVLELDLSEHIGAEIPVFVLHGLIQTFNPKG